VTTAPRPLWMIGRENYNHGAAVYKKRKHEADLRSYGLVELHENLNLTPNRIKIKDWKREELEELWRLRSEERKTYDELAVRFGGVDTQVVVDALTELRRRKQAGCGDMFRPIGERENKAPAKSAKPKYEIDERIQRMCIMHGMGMTYGNIAEEMGANQNAVSTAIRRLRKRNPGMYQELCNKGARARNAERSEKQNTEK